MLTLKLVLIVLVAPCSQAVVLLSANIQDVKTLARKFLPEPVAEEITHFLRRLASGKNEPSNPDPNMSAENAKYEDRLISSYSPDESVKELARPHHGKKLLSSGVSNRLENQKTSRGHYLEPHVLPETLDRSERLRSHRIDQRWSVTISEMSKESATTKHHLNVDDDYIPLVKIKDRMENLHKDLKEIVRNKNTLYRAKQRDQIPGLRNQNGQTQNWNPPKNYAVLPAFTENQYPYLKPEIPKTHAKKPTLEPVFGLTKTKQRTADQHVTDDRLSRVSAKILAFNIELATEKSKRKFYQNPNMNDYIVATSGPIVLKARSRGSSMSSSSEELPVMRSWDENPLNHFIQFAPVSEKPGTSRTDEVKSLGLRPVEPQVERSMADNPLYDAVQLAPVSLEAPASLQKDTITPFESWPEGPILRSKDEEPLNEGSLVSVDNLRNEENQLGEPTPRSDEEINFWPGTSPEPHINNENHFNYAMQVAPVSNPQKKFQLDEVTPLVLNLVHGIKVKVDNGTAETREKPIKPLGRGKNSYDEDKVGGDADNIRGTAKKDVNQSSRDDHDNNVNTDRVDEVNVINETGNAKEGVNTNRYDDNKARNGTTPEN